MLTRLAGCITNFNSLHRHFIFAVKRCNLRMGAALLHWASPEINPFLSSEIRRSIRQRSGPFFILWPMLSIGVALVLTAQFRDTAVTALSQFVANESLDSRWASLFLGDNSISLMTLVAAGLCGFAALAYNHRASQILQRENLSGTLSQLQLLPLSETRLAFLTSAPAAFFALALWAMLLPLWLLALVTNQWSWREFLGLPIILLMIGVRPPVWTPLYETDLSLDPHLATPGEDEVDEEENNENNENKKRGIRHTFTTRRGWSQYEARRDAK